VRRGTASPGRRVKRLRHVVGAVALAAGAAACSSVPVATESTVRHPSTVASLPRTTIPAPPAPADQLTAIAFFDPTTGYGLFMRQRQPTCEAVVGSTTDGGAMFSSLTVVTSWSCPSAAPVQKLAFDDQGDGFLYDPDLFVTHDGGTSWTQVPQSGVVVSVEALGSSVWAVESSCPAPTDLGNPCPMRLLESDDGGLTWDAVAVPSGATTDGLGAQTWLVRLSATAGYLASNPTFNFGGQASTAPLWYTADSGRTWSARQVDCGFNALTDAISAAPDGTLVAVCANQPSAGSQPKSTVRSTDGGYTWTTMTSCPGGTGVVTFSCATAPPLVAGYLGEIDAVTADTVYLVGGRSSLLVTHNGGATWAVVETTIGDTSDGTQNVIFFNPSDGVVLGEDGQNDDVVTIWSTSDGGATWQAVVPVG
jgi:photosystem II stability/assembly factor-like uncharacterized protein